MTYTGRAAQAIADAAERIFGLDPRDFSEDDERIEISGDYRRAVIRASSRRRKMAEAEPVSRATD